ncbi:MAG: hypothetical protein LBL39_07175, partial [Planctomycetaceae bacterium]|nr:hypothetical protein [Planctomycetaceae bacterium]
NLTNHQKHKTNNGRKQPLAISLCMAMVFKNHVEAIRFKNIFKQSTIHNTDRGLTGKTSYQLRKHKNLHDFRLGN